MTAGSVQACQAEKVFRPEWQVGVWLSALSEEPAARPHSLTCRAFLALNADSMAAWSLEGRPLGRLRGCGQARVQCDLLQTSSTETHMAISALGADEQRGAGPISSLGVVDLRRCRWAARVHSLHGSLASASPEGLTWHPAENSDAAAPRLQGTTALFFDEARRELYTGDSEGRVHAWSC